MKLPSVLVYSILRLLAFLVPLGILLIFPIFQTYWWLAVAFAALIGLALSLLFLRRTLGAVSTDIAQRRQRATAPDADEDFEDAVADGTTDAASADERPEK